jgi:glutaredoxin 3
MYTSPSCPFCVRAKRLLAARGIDFEEIDVSTDDELRAGVIERTGRRTVPQIFIDGQSIGGFEELAAMDAAGELADLSGAPVA